MCFMKVLWTGRIIVDNCILDDRELTPINCRLRPVRARLRDGRVQRPEGTWGTVGEEEYGSIRLSIGIY